MIITVKNLQQQTFTVNFNPEKTVLELKQTIFNERGSEYVVEKQKLIYAGVILDDDNRTIASYNVDEKKFVVVMLKRDAGGPGQKSDGGSVSRPAASEPKASVSSATSENSGNDVKKSEDRANPQKSGTSAPPATASLIDSTASAQASTTGSSSSENRQGAISGSDLAGVLLNTSLQPRTDLLMGEDYNQTVESLIEMGYSRELVGRAMAASFNNAERAVEYLINGIPETNEEGFDANSAAAILRSVAGAGRNRSDGDGAVTRGSDGAGGDGSGNLDDARQMSGDPFEFLRNQPQFLQMRSLVYQNPALLQAVLQQIGQTNPALLQLISENQDAFLHMLNQPIEGTQRTGETGGGGAEEVTSVAQPERRAATAADVSSAVGAVETERSEGGGDADNAGVQLDPANNEGGPTIRLTLQDRDAIDRLKDLGFPEILVLQAYFACDKNEELAANFLISTTFDD